MSSHGETRQLFIDKCCQKYSWAAGAARGTQAAVQWHKRDLEVAFAEIDGLMAGLHYEDEASTTSCSLKSPAPPSAQPSRTPFPDADVELPSHSDRNAYPYSAAISLDDLDDFISPVSPMAAENSGPAQQPNASQWTAIRNLKDETEVHHQRFQKIAAAMGNPELLKLRDSYPDSKTVRNTGLVIFKDVLDGYQPRKLKEVFAFACLSYAISQLLFRKGHIDKSEILGGVRSWRDLISDQRERHAFNILALELWPEAKDHMHCIPIPDRARRISVDNSGPGDVAAAGCSEFAVPGRDPLLTSDPSVRTSTDPLPVANPLLLDFENVNAHLADVFEYSPQPEIHDTLTNTHQAYNFSALSPRMIPAFSEDPPVADRLRLPPTHAELDQDRRETVFADPKNGEDSPQPTNTTSDVKKIEETSMFLVIFTFLLGFGELLSVLSGRNLSSRQYKLYGAEEEDRKRFFHFARESFFQPRREDPNFVPPTFLALLSTAQLFTKKGGLRSIDEIEHYLCSVAVVTFPPGVIFGQFMSWVLCGRSLRHNEDSKRPRTVAPNDSPQDAEPSQGGKKRAYQCDYDECSAQYEDLGALSRHRTHIHQKPASICCPLCPYKSPRRDRVRRHFLKGHTDHVLPENLEGRPRASTSTPCVPTTPSL